MKVIEIILAVIALIGALFIMRNYPGGALFTGLSLSSLSMLYFIFSFALLNTIGFRKMFKKASYQEVSSTRIVETIVYGLLFMAVPIGILFHLNKYPGYEMMLGIAFLNLICILIIATIRYFMVKKPSRYLPVIIRVILWGVPTGLMMIL